MKAPGKQDLIYRLAFVQPKPALAMVEHKILRGEAAVWMSWRPSPWSRNEFDPWELSPWSPFVLPELPMEGMLCVCAHMRVDKACLPCSRLHEQKNRAYITTEGFRWDEAYGRSL